MTTTFVDNQTDECVDYIWVKLHNYQCNRKPLYIGTFYFRSHAHARKYAAVRGMITEFAMKGKDILIAGDFNIRDFKPNTDRNVVTRDARLNELSCIIDVAQLHSYNNYTRNNTDY